jgi:hypothetical protein
MDFSKGDGWAKLCEFLGIKKVPSRPFPHKNSKGARAQREARAAAGAAPARPASGA